MSEGLFKRLEACAAARVSRGSFRNIANRKRWAISHHPASSPPQVSSPPPHLFIFVPPSSLPPFFLLSSPSLLDPSCPLYTQFSFLFSSSPHICNISPPLPLAFSLVSFLVFTLFCISPLLLHPPPLFCPLLPFPLDFTFPILGLEGAAVRDDGKSNPNRSQGPWTARPGEGALVPAAHLLLGGPSAWQPGQG